MPVSRLPYALAAAALAAALAPALPAAAAPPARGCASGGASADLLRVYAAAPSTTAAARQSPVGLRVASSQVEMSSSRTTATARALDGPLAAPGTATEQAPPTPPGSGHQVGAAPVDVGDAKVGTGDLRARATWPAGYRCGSPAGPSASSSTALVDATVLPEPGGWSMVRVPRNVNSAADVGLSLRDRHAATSVTARVGLGEVSVLDGTDAGVRVRVVSEPTLTATAGGTVARSSVHYTAPVFEVIGKAGTRRLEVASQHLDIPVPPEALGSAVPAGAGSVVLRLSIGAVSQHVTGTSITAEAGTLRVQLLAGSDTLLDLGVGVLQVNAGAPADPPPAPATLPGDGPTLPLTGVNAGWLVGIGVLIAIGGRLLLLLSRRRARSGP